MTAPDDEREARWFADVTRILRTVAQSDVVELDLQVGETRVYLRRQVSAALTAPSPLPAAVAPASGLIPVRTPLTGVYYLRPSPAERAYVEEGDVVSVGQIVGLVEAMKVFNEIRSEVAGRVVRIVAHGGELVETGQVLMEIEPTGAG